MHFRKLLQNYLLLDVIGRSLLNIFRCPVLYADVIIDSLRWERILPHEKLSFILSTKGLKKDKLIFFMTFSDISSRANYYTKN